MNNDDLNLENEALHTRFEALDTVDAILDAMVTNAKRISALEAKHQELRVKLINLCFPKRP